MAEGTDVHGAVAVVISNASAARILAKAPRFAIVPSLRGEGSAVESRSPTAFAINQIMVHIRSASIPDSAFPGDSVLRTG